MNRIDKFLEYVTVKENGIILDKDNNELPVYTSGGYKYVALDGIGFIPVHQLVATVYIKKPEFNPDGTPIVGKYEVNHIDRGKSNNNVSNLEWVDHSYNLRHSGVMKNRKDLSMRVFVWNPVTDNYCTYESLRDTARKNNVPASTLCNAINKGKEYRGLYLFYMGESTPEEFHDYVKTLFKNTK